MDPFTAASRYHEVAVLIRPDIRQRPFFIMVSHCCTRGRLTKVAVKQLSHSPGFAGNASSTNLHTTRKTVSGVRALYSSARNMPTCFAWGFPGAG